VKRVSKRYRFHLIGPAALATFGSATLAPYAQAQTVPAATGASAVQAASQPSAQPGDASKSDKANKPNQVTLAPVTVTAAKRKQNARDVTSSISVVGHQQLENQHVTSLVDLAGSLPGVQIDSGGTPGQTSISMRGISSLDVGSVVGTYIDDSPLGSSSSFAAASRYQLDLLPYDVDRIEVLRGPQGTLYGASTMGGLLKYVMKEPDLDNLYGSIGSGVSTTSGASGAGWDGRAMINVPLIKDKLAFSASVSQNDTPGWVDNAVTGQTDVNHVTQKSSRFALFWMPTSDVSVKVQAIHQSINASDTGVILLDPTTEQPIYGINKTGTVIAQPFSNNLNFYSATLNWDLHAMDFTSATSFSRTDRTSTVDDTAVYGPVFNEYGFQGGVSPLELQENLSKFTQEFRLASKPGGQVEWLAGAFFTHESSNNLQLLGAKAADGSPLPELDPLLNVDLPTSYTEAALFGDLTYKFTDRFDVTGGLRYAKNWQTYSYGISGIGAGLEGLSDSSGSSSEGSTTWMFSPRYRLTDNSMVYFRAATGYRPGSPNLPLPGVPAVVHSDTLTSYELGWKSLLLDKRLSVDMAVYDINWKNIQLNNYTPTGVAYLANGGTAKSQGAEVSLAYLPIRNLKLGLNAAYTDSRLTQDAPSLGGKSGDSLPNIPKVTWSYTTDYSFPLPWDLTGHAGGDYRWTGARWSSFSSSSTNWREGSYGVLDLYANVTARTWTLRLYAKNLNNQHPLLNVGYLQNAATGQIAVLDATSLQPRTIGVELDTQF